MTEENKPIPTESKAQAWRRLESEGRWKDFREKCKEFKKQSKTRDEAFFMALPFFPPLGETPAQEEGVFEGTHFMSQDDDDDDDDDDDEEGESEDAEGEEVVETTGEPMASCDPVLDRDPEVVDRDLDELEELVGTREGGSDFATDFEWAYRNITNAKVTPTDAPSGGAWFLLTYGRNAKAKFCELALRFFTKTGRENNEEKRIEDDRRERLAVIDRLLD
tara:strand:+ start:1032 stop:1691 length:660 start_codon:yes stop_codon:yes gene_type:complete